MRCYVLRKTCEKQQRCSKAAEVMVSLLLKFGADATLKDSILTGKRQIAGPFTFSFKNVSIHLAFHLAFC